MEQHAVDNRLPVGTTAEIVVIKAEEIVPVGPQAAPQYSCPGKQEIWDCAHLTKYAVQHPMRQRFLLIATIVIVIAGCLAWLFAAAIGWTLRDIMHGTGSPQTASNARLAIAMFVMTGINLLALLVFIVRRNWGWWLLVIVQVGELVMSLVEGFTRTPSWWPFTGLAALTLLLLFMMERPPPAHFRRPITH